MDNMPLPVHPQNTMRKNMATIEVSRQHSLELKNAREAVLAVAARLQDDLKARHHWVGDSLKFECPGANGCIDVDKSNVRVSVNLSLLLRPARKRIEQAINNYLDEYLV
jgi:putative polyhydroxyalkanoate system protein